MSQALNGQFRTFEKGEVFHVLRLRQINQDGHAFAGLGYNQEGVKIATWGLLGTLTWAAIEKYLRHSDGGELYTALSEDSIMKASAKAPNGLDILQLTNDIRMLQS